MPIAIPALGELGVLALILWLVATALAIALVMRYVGNVFRGVPVVGGYIADAVNAVASAISSAAGKLENGIDHLIGWSWHLLAGLLDRLWAQLEAQAHTLAMVAQTIEHDLYRVTGLRSLVHSLTRAWHGIEHGIKTLTREFHGIEARVRALERAITRGIGHDLRIEIKALEREWHGFKTKELPAIEADVGALGADVATAERWVAKNFVSTKDLATEATAAVVLTAAGAGWLRCNSNPFNNNKNACGLWGTLGRMLGLAGFLAAAFDFPEFVAAAEEVASFIGSAVNGIEGSFPLSLPPLPPPQ